jgi:saccharopine dehydrogenase-like NADP-dependent oxidoreductase
MLKTFHIFGSGGIGQAAILSLECGFPGSHYHVYDVQLESIHRYFSTLEEEVKMRINYHIANVLETKDLEIDGDFVLDCTPGNLSPYVAKIAMRNGIGYINLTEYVNETQIITELAGYYKEAAVILQSGVAPGFVNIAGKSLLNIVDNEYQENQFERLEMMVGALSSNARSPHFYAFTWSPIGVATEYIKSSFIVQDYQLKEVNSLDQISTHIINGQVFESAYTSGGVADIAEKFAASIKNIGYQTLRYPGHFHWIKNLIKDKKIEDPQILLAEMEKQIPFVEEDKIIIFTYLDYFNAQHKLQSTSKYFEVLPRTIFGVPLRAIQIATAIPMVISIDWALNFGIKGLVTQSMIDSDFVLQHELVREYFFTAGNVNELTQV